MQDNEKKKELEERGTNSLNGRQIYCKLAKSRLWDVAVGGLTCAGHNKR